MTTKSDINHLDFKAPKKDSPYRNFQAYPQTDPLDYVMKIGKNKGKSLREITETTKGKYYVHWFAENIVTPENEKYYGKILKVNKMLLETNQIQPQKKEDSE